MEQKDKGVRRKTNEEFQGKKKGKSRFSFRNNYKIIEQKDKNLDETPG